jgi:hypothetical protein
MMLFAFMFVCMHACMYVCMYVEYQISIKNTYFSVKFYRGKKGKQMLVNIIKIAALMC